MKTVAHLHNLNLTTPECRVEHTTPSEFAQYLDTIEQERLHGFDANNWIRQLQAMQGHDVSATFGGSMDKVASAVHARVLVVAALQDHMVNPEPALDLARLLVSPTLELTSDCGHLAPGCEQERVAASIARFLDR